MKIPFFFTAIIALFLLSCTSEKNSLSVAQINPILPQNPHLEELTKEYVELFDSILVNTNTPGAALAIIKDGRVLHLEGHGIKVAKTKDLVDENTVFRIGSLSKGFSAILAGILVEQGQLQWTDKVNKYIPEFVLKDSLQSNRVNLIHLLSQTSGLPYHAYTNLVEAGIDVRAIAQQLKKVNLIAKEGEIYAYQNATFSLIGAIMEVVAKKPLPQIYQGTLFTPLLMENTSTNYNSLVNSENFAQPHSGGGAKWRKRTISKKYYNSIPAGGINASISDMSDWLQLLLGNRPDIISEATLDEVFLPRINTKNRKRYFRHWPMVEEAYYGLGWRILTNPRDTFIYHGGYVNGYRGEILINRKENLGICVLVNAPSKLASRAIPVFLEQYALKRDSITAWEERLLKK